MLFVGDVHSYLDDFASIVQKYPKELIIQVGDMGLARPWLSKNIAFKTPDFPLKGSWAFIRGNHDDPALCRAHPKYLGEWGVLETPEGTLFFVSGARSVDWQWRTPGVNYWHDEELTQKEMDKAIKNYRRQRPSIVVTHDCPDSIKHHIIDYTTIPSITGWGLDRMFEYHQPAVWIFGHHHGWLNKTINGTRFVCIPELQTYHLQSD